MESAATQGRGAVTEIRDPVIKPVRCRTVLADGQDAQALTSDSSESMEANSASVLRFLYWRDDTSSSSSLLWYRYFCLRDQRTITSASAIAITAMTAPEAPCLNRKVRGLNIRWGPRG